MCPALPYNTVGRAGGLSKKVTLHQVPGSQVLPRPLVCVTAETWEKNHKYIFTVTEEMEAKSTRQKRGEAPSFMKQEGEGKGRKHLGLNIVVWVAQLMKARKFEMCTRQPDTPILHSGPQTKAALWGAGTAGGVAAEGGTQASFPFNGCSVSKLKTKMLFCGPTLGPCPAPSSGDTVPWLRRRHLACSSPWNAEIQGRFHQWILPSHLDIGSCDIPGLEPNSPGTVPATADRPTGLLQRKPNAAERINQKGLQVEPCAGSSERAPEEGRPSRWWHHREKWQRN